MLTTDKNASKNFIILTKGGLKMKLLKKYLKYIILIGGMTLTFIFGLKMNQPSSAQALVVEEQKMIEQRETNIVNTRKNIDIQKQLQAERIKSAKDLVTSLEAKNELILLEVKGQYTETFDKTPDNNKWTEWLKNSEMEMVIDYKAIYSIPLDRVIFTINEAGIINVDYDLEAIEVRSVEIMHHTPLPSRSIMGSKYTYDELIACIEIGKDGIRDNLQNNLEYTMEAKKNFESSIAKLSRSFGVYAITFNNGTALQTSAVSFKNNGTAKYGSKYATLSNVEYVVVHSTANLNADGDAHWKYLNNNEEAAGAHFYVDADSVDQMYDLKFQSYHCGGGPKINNGNSIGIEICEFDDPVLQQKAIDNAIRFIEDVLSPALDENVELVTHNDVTGKDCPRIMIGQSQTPVISWETFKAMCTDGVK